MKIRRLHFLPGALFILVMVTFAATYCIAVLNDHVDPDFPYISDTGTKPPESCIFAQFINIAAFLLAGCVYVRYLQIEEVQRNAGVGAAPLPAWCNRAAAAFGYVACLGLDVVANFQESNVLVVHMIGAFVCFFAATVFFCIQTYISRKLMPLGASAFSFGVRVFVSVMCIVLSITTVVPGGLSLYYFNGDEDDEDAKFHWRPEDGGFTLHLVSTISEWALVLCFCIFIASFSGEFRGLFLHGPFLKITETSKYPQTI